MTPVVKALLWSNGIAFLAQALLGDRAFAAFMLWPWGEHFLGYEGSTPVTLHHSRSSRQRSTSDSSRRTLW